MSKETSTITPWVLLYTPNMGPAGCGHTADSKNKGVKEIWVERYMWRAKSCNSENIGNVSSLSVLWLGVMRPGVVGVEEWLHDGSASCYMMLVRRWEARRRFSH